jgi:hypothetical protein
MAQGQQERAPSRRYGVVTCQRAGRWKRARIGFLRAGAARAAPKSWLIGGAARARAAARSCRGCAGPPPGPAPGGPGPTAAPPRPGNAACRRRPGGRVPPAGPGPPWAANDSPVMPHSSRAGRPGRIMEITRPPLPTAPMAWSRVWPRRSPAARRCRREPRPAPAGPTPRRGSRLPRWRPGPAGSHGCPGWPRQRAAQINCSKRNVVLSGAPPPMQPRLLTDAPRRQLV